jgi:ubiquinone/menaquinone biosynthesis C-methylase UbiE
MKKQDQQKDFVYIKKKNIHYVLDGQGHIKKYKPWLGDIFSFLYDRIMERSVIPVKLNANVKKHLEILEKESGGIHHANILEIATGSGNAAKFLNRENHYTGIDISPGLLRKAYSRFKESGFEQFDLFIASASDLPFSDHQFDYALCHLSLNFFDDIEPFSEELRRVLKKGATFFCSVPVPERKPAKSKIHGTLYTAEELKAIFQDKGFEFESKSYENGAIFYFSASIS